MATTNHPKTFADLYTTVLNNAGADSSVTATVNEAKRMVNSALHDIHLTSGEKFQWAHRRSFIQTQDDQTGTGATATKGSATFTAAAGSDFTGTDTLGNTKATANLSHLVISGTDHVYSLASVDSATQLTLNENYVDTTSTDASWTLFHDEYALEADFLRPLSLRSFDANSEIPLVGKNKFEAMYPRNYTVGKPVIACILDLGFSGSVTPVRRVRFHKPPDDYYTIPYWYVTSNLAVDASGSGAAELSGDTDEPIVPLSFRMMICHHALAQWFRDRMDDMERSDRHQQAYQDILIRAQLLNEFGEDRPCFQPKVAPYRRRARMPYRGGGRRIHTTGTAWDEMRV